MAARVTEVRANGSFTVTVDATCRICGEDTGRGAGQWRLCRACRPEAARLARLRRAAGDTEGAPWDVALGDDVRAAVTFTAQLPEGEAPSVVDFVRRMGAYTQNIAGQR